ncbi:MAG TPA: hypothetical protein VI685_08025 [Candidatus Angelobacter sp.]
MSAQPTMKSAYLAVLLLCVVAAAQQSGMGEVHMTIPGVSGALDLDVGPTRWQTRVRDDGIETQMQAMNRPDLVLVSAFLQKVKFAASAEKCRDEWWKGTEKNNKSHGFKMEHLTKSSDGTMARVEFFVAEFQGKEVKQQSLHAYLGSGNLCAEIHLSKVAFSPDDEKLFEAVLVSARLIPGEAAADGANQDKTSFDYAAEGSKSYLLKDYSAAIRSYQKAVELEKQKRSLDQTQFRVVIDNLGIAYGITGDISRSMETLKYGISQDPEYPMFYYNMACGYGELGKMEESLEQLRLVYKYKANMIAGEVLPDPLNDSSFRKFVKDKKFVDSLRQMQQE